VMGTNPAGIGIYRSNDVALSFGFNNTAAKSNFYGTCKSGTLEQAGGRKAAQSAGDPR
jgi:hypothetical protein